MPFLKQLWSQSTHPLFSGYPHSTAGILRKGGNSERSLGRLHGEAGAARRFTCIEESQWFLAASSAHADASSQLRKFRPAHRLTWASTGGHLAAIQAVLPRLYSRIFQNHLGENSKQLRWGHREWLGSQMKVYLPSLPAFCVGWILLKICCR